MNQKFYHVIRCKGLAIYTSNTEEPWNETMTLLRVVTGDDRSKKSWTPLWGILGEPHQFKDIFYEYCIGSFSDLNEAYACAAIEVL